jgi:hypothetical protein
MDEVVRLVLQAKQSKGGLMGVTKLLRRDWVFLETATLVFLCARCKARAQLILPANAESFIKQMRNFQEKHKKCKPEEK